MLLIMSFSSVAKNISKYDNNQKTVYTGEPISLNIQEMGLDAFLFLLGDFTNLVFSKPDCNMTIAVQVKNQPWDKVLHDVAIKYDLTVKRENKVVYVNNADYEKRAACKKKQKLSAKRTNWVE